MTRPVNGHSNLLRNMASAKSRGHNRKTEEAASPKLMVQHIAYKLRRDNANTVPISSPRVAPEVSLATSFVIFPPVQNFKVKVTLDFKEPDI
eukprot:CAMPEP_0171598470 /NCGR_PEP_ID=MMETSP0990-20121206/3153_1 /TAXON_ID=483369 /ORGANISM="non described non described, Strain CCMP2098" /LENGTH=91 /DNA_ID=CAMNT_0012160055 /DNA_START=17 /DNA_END=292 /DNA_ORIENTATION=-